MHPKTWQAHRTEMQREDFREWLEGNRSPNPVYCQVI
jgi:hypothetical protein